MGAVPDVRSMMRPVKVRMIGALLAVVVLGSIGPAAAESPTDKLERARERLDKVQLGARGRVGHVRAQRGPGRDHQRPRRAHAGRRDGGRDRRRPAGAVGRPDARRARRARGAPRRCCAGRAPRSSSSLQERTARMPPTSPAAVARSVVDGADARSRAGAERGQVPRRRRVRGAGLGADGSGCRARAAAGAAGRLRVGARRAHRARRGVRGPSRSLRAPRS